MPNAQKTRATVPDAIDVGHPDYDSIMRGLDQAKDIINGTAEPGSYVVHQVRVPDQVDVKAIRAKTKLSQAAFAERYGFSAGAVRDWEQRRKAPERANRILLTIIDRRPDVIEELMTA